MKIMKPLTNTALLFCEGAVLLLLTIAFWHLPAIRQDWWWLFSAALPIFWLRRVVRGYIIPSSPLNGFLILFWVLTLFNFFYEGTPYQRASYLDVMARPLLGMWTVIYLVDLALVTRRQVFIVVPSLGIATVLALIALTATGWLPNKEPVLAPLMAVMPVINYREFVPEMLLGFNPNEIAGALAWLTPFCFVIAMGWRSDQGQRIGHGLRIWAALVFALLFIALFLGQSRFGLAGVLFALLLMSIFALTRWRSRLIAIAAIGLVVAFQAALLFNIFTPTSDTGVSSRDERSVTQRLIIWDRAVSMIADYPVTGVGMSMYRTAVNNDPYIILDNNNNPRFVPHAHNALLQIGTDLGIGGLFVYSVWHLAAAWMLWTAWRNPQQDLRILALAVAAGWVAHSVYSVGDTIALWDRYAFLFWWMLGLVGAVNALQHEPRPM